MPRDVRAYLADVVDACDAITAAVHDVGFRRDQSSRLIRSSVEREFITIGEALAALGRAAAEVFDRIAQARRIVDFRNQLTHQYRTVDDAIVWAIAERDVPVLHRECADYLRRLGSLTDAGSKGDDD
ncbi:MAG: hypothetical protein HW416_3762 [Chloroflexi bacterium]|nr:hypothetical protein [Chloroflexota bacterium]